jgi:uncharacterized protein (TIGR00730 family)
MALRTINSVAAFCGSNFGVLPDFAKGARALGQALSEAGITLVYGGTKNGLMGILCDAVLESGGTVHGVITANLHQLGRSHARLTKQEIAQTLRIRKERMVAQADAFIALPGGIGTIDELMDVWSMNQLSEIDKPIGLLDTAGFYSPFLNFIDHMVTMKFLPGAHRESICVDDDAKVLIEKLYRHQRLEVPKAL